MKDKKFAVALDGPSGAGKSTIAKAVARKMGLVYVDTGALYRSIALASVEAGIETPDASNMQPLLDKISLNLVYQNDAQRVILNEQDVSEKIRTPEVSLAASKVSALPLVRTYLLDLQRDIARKGAVIMDGRDIGTVILPDAEVKIFLTASDEERARRRYLELLQKGEMTTLEQVLEDMRIRDARDMARETAPLKQADDAVLLDASELSLEQAIEAVLDIIHAKIQL